MDSKEAKTEAKSEPVATESTAAATTPAAGGKNNAMMYLIIFIIVALIAGGAAFFLMNKDDKKSDDDQEESSDNNDEDEEESDEDEDVEEEDDNDSSSDNGPRGDRTATLDQTPEEYADEFENLSDSELVLTMQFLGFKDIDEDEAQDIAEEMIDIYEEYYDGKISDIEYLNKFSKIYTDRGATFFGANDDGSSNLDDLSDYEDLFDTED